MKFKVPYSAMPRVQFETVGPSLTRQSSKEECDINRIMMRFEKTGVLEHRNNFEGSYGDYTDTPQDYHEAVNQVLAADAMFAALPARIRKRFGNDPAEYVDFVADPANRGELVSLGLASVVPGPADPFQDAIDRQEPKAAPKPSPKPPADTPAD